MKKTACLLIFSCFNFLAMAQSVKTVQVTTAGTLHSLISETESNTISTLTISGNIDARDFAFIRDDIKLLSTLDLLNVTIIAYAGTEGTNSGIETTYPAKELPMNAFYNPCLRAYKSTLTALKLPSNLISIGSLACYFCWNLDGQISIPASVKSIADYAFYGCYALTTFSVSSSNTRYSSSNGVLLSKSQDTLFIFPNGKSGTYTIPSSVKRIHHSAFENAYNLTSVTIPSSVTSIGSYAFCNCSGITGDLSLSGSLTKLEAGAFCGCYNLNGTVTLPASLKQLGTFCFFESNAIQSFSVSNSNTAYSSNNGALYSKKQDTLFICPGGKKGTFTLPSTVRLIGSYAFYKCDSLTGNMNIPLDVDYIGHYAFYGCKNVSSFTADTQNAYFTSADGVLYSKSKDRILVCPTIKSGTFNAPANLRYIDPCTFSFCSKLTGFIHIPDSVESIGDFAFYGCEGISGFTTAPENLHFSALNGLLYNKGMDTLFICPLSKSGQYMIPSGVRFIGHSAFDGCTGLTEITLPTTVSEIGNYAFEYCTGLVSADVPSSVSKLGQGVFYNCTNLQNLTVEHREPPVVDYYFLEGIDKTTCKLTVPINAKNLYKDAPYWGNFSTIVEKNFIDNLRATEAQIIKAFIGHDECVVTGLAPGYTLKLINLDGKCICTRMVTSGTLSIPLPERGLYIVKSGNKSIKIVY